ncbi:MAG: hypothetical protein J6I76_17785 [Oribacterium sp.]|nr:hypothetical protein [Oribacterium sp.]
MPKESPFENKTAKQLAEEGYQAVLAGRNKRKNMSPEEILMEEIEDDAEGGYHFYEDEEIELTREIVHAGGEVPDSINFMEDFFPDGTSYVSEEWNDNENYVKLVTYYFSTDAVNGEEEIEDYLIRMGKLKDEEDHGDLKILVLDCPAGEIFSATVVVEDWDEDIILCHAEL